MGAALIAESDTGERPLASARRSHQVLAERGIAKVPDLLASAGGVIRSFFESTRFGGSCEWPVSAVGDALVARLDTAFDQATAFAAELTLALRDAALRPSVQRVADAYLARGVYP